MRTWLECAFMRVEITLRALTILALVLRGNLLSWLALLMDTCFTIATFSALAFNLEVPFWLISSTLCDCKFEMRFSFCLNICLGDESNLKGDTGSPLGDSQATKTFRFLSELESSLTGPKGLLTALRPHELPVKYHNRCWGQCVENALSCFEDASMWLLCYLPTS